MAQNGLRKYLNWGDKLGLKGIGPRGPTMAWAGLLVTIAMIKTTL